MTITNSYHAIIRSVVALATASAAASAQDFTISNATIAGGAATVSGGNLSLAGTTGQAIVGGSSGGVFDTTGGFWAGPPALPGCSAADIALPYGILNFFDVATYIGLYNSADLAADLAAPFGILNFFDIAAFPAEFGAGCP